jgi:hypothetical protein
MNTKVATNITFDLGSIHGPNNILILEPIRGERIELINEELYDITKNKLHEHIHMQHTCFEPNISQQYFDVHYLAKKESILDWIAL